MIMHIVYFKMHFHFVNYRHSCFQKVSKADLDTCAAYEPLYSIIELAYAKDVGCDTGIVTILYHCNYYILSMQDMKGKMIQACDSVT